MTCNKHTDCIKHASAISFLSTLPKEIKTFPFGKTFQKIRLGVKCHCLGLCCADILHAPVILIILHFTVNVKCGATMNRDKNCKMISILTFIPDLKWFQLFLLSYFYYI